MSKIEKQECYIQELQIEINELKKLSLEKEVEHNNRMEVTELNINLPITVSAYDYADEEIKKLKIEIEKLNTNLKDNEKLREKLVVM